MEVVPTVGRAYTGKILRVNLTAEKLTTQEVDPGTVRKFMGGVGLAARILWDETRGDTQPLAEESPLVLMTGPLTGTHVPASSRYVAVGISPLTGIFGEAYGGGTWPYRFRSTPYMGIVIKGKAKRPVYLQIKDEEARIADASDLWGRDTYETYDLLRERGGKAAGILTIGQAGERQVKQAAIMGDGRAGRAAARCGLGALMGSKNLKAIMAKGRGRPLVNDEAGLRASISQHFPSVTFDRDRFVQKISEAYLSIVDQRGCIKNFTRGQFPGFGDKLVELAINSEPWFCIGCRTGCHVSMMHGGLRHPTGQTMQPFGSNCLIDDVEALLKAFDLCGRYGLDSISTGQVIAFAMELYEKGLLTKGDTDGIDLRWGNQEAMLQTLTKIGNGEGFGALLGEGVRAVALRLGGNAIEYAMQVKGLEFPQYDPRCDNALALQYATSSLGAHHMEGITGVYSGKRPSHPFMYALPYLKDEEARQALQDPFAVKGKGKQVVWGQDFDNVIDSIGVCKLILRPAVWVRDTGGPFPGIQPEHLLEWLNLVAGWDMSLGEFMKTGERIFNLKRLFNVRRGISRKDDFLPPRILTRKRGGEGPVAENLPPLGAMLNEYYAERGWSEEGIPTYEKLAELGIP